MDQQLTYFIERSLKMKNKAINIKITINDDHVLHAQFENNATTQALISQMPFTISMNNLYGREMCHRYGNGALPLDDAKDRNYKVGDISYWPPMGSLVILYEQNGEVFEQQKIGHTQDDVSFFNHINRAEVTFEQE